MQVVMLCLIYLICVGYNLGKLINLLENSLILSVFIQCCALAQAGQSLALLTKDKNIFNMNFILPHADLQNVIFCVL